MARSARLNRTSGRELSHGLALPLVAVAMGLMLVVDRVGATRLSLTPPGLGLALLLCLLAFRGLRQTRRDRQVRLHAERAAAQSDRLAQLTLALGQGHTPRAIIEAAVQEPLHALGADAAQLLLVSRDGKTAEIARTVGYAQPAPSGTLALSEKSPISDAVGRGAPVVIESPEAWNGEYGDRPHGKFETTAVVPLVIGSRTAALVQLDFQRRRTFAAGDREYMLAVGARGAQALDRAWQFEFTQRARTDAEDLRARADAELVERETIEHALRASETRYRALAARTSRLHTLTAALSEAVTTKAVAQAVVHHGRVVVGATSGEATLLAENGATFELLYSEAPDHQSNEPQRTAVDSGLCATQAVQSRQPVFVGSFAEWQEHYWRSASIAADGGYESSATLPLLVEGTPIGVLAFHFTMPVNFDDDYQALLVSVAQHCAQALDRSRLYESAQRARSDAESANRLKDEFVSIVSHELRTPLNAIIGWASILQRGAVEPATAARALQSIRDNAARQTTLIDELLDFSRMTAGRTALHTEEVDVGELVGGVVESMLPSASAGGVDLQLSPVPPATIAGDPRRLEQVLFNLIANAVKFTPRGGRVSIDVGLTDGRVTIRVSDTGAGIDPEFLPHVFDRFRQADSSTTRSYGGLGLGLAIAKQLVEAHQGTIAAESGGKDQGAAFVVSLPTVARHAAESSVTNVVASPQSVPPRLDGVHVLVVEDEADTRDLIAHALESCGARVALASRAGEAFEMLARLDIDVLLADIAMPGENGLSLIRRVRSAPAARVASVPAAAVTALARSDQRDEALAAGFNVHVAKPFEPAGLMRAIESLARAAIH